MIKKTLSQNLKRMSDGGLFMEYLFEMEDKQERFNFTVKLSMFLLLDKNENGVPQFKLNRTFE